MFKLIRLFIPVLIIVFVLPMLIPGPDGKPIMSFSDWLPSQQTLRNIGNSVGDTINGAAALVGQEPVIATAASKKLYKWQDQHGRWHFSDDPKQVPSHAKAQAMPQLANSTMAAPPQTKAADNDAGPSFSLSPTTLPITQIPQLIDDAKKVREQIEARNQQLEQQ
jgi:hypothetical protein